MSSGPSPPSVPPPQHLRSLAARSQGDRPPVQNPGHVSSEQVQAIKEYQRQRRGGSGLWHDYCDKHFRRKRDPAKLPFAKVQCFIDRFGHRQQPTAAKSAPSSVESQLQDLPDDAWQQTTRILDKVKPRTAAGVEMR